MSATEKNDVKTVEVKPQSAPLVGRGAMSEAERAAFLQQAREYEKQYSAYSSHVDEKLRSTGFNFEANPLVDANEFRIPPEQRRFHDPDHPVNLKPEVESGLARVGILRERINAQLDSPFPDSHYVSSQLQESLKAYASTQTTLVRNQAVLESRLESRNVTNPSVSVATGAEAEAAVSTNAKSKVQTAWHKAPEPYANYPLHLTESFRQANASAMLNASEAGSTAKTTFKPYVAPDDPSPLYTDKAENKNIRSLYDNAAVDPHRTPISPDQIKRASKYMMAAAGLMAAAEAANATQGTIKDKVDSASKVLKDQVVDVIPGVTYTQKMAAGKYQEAALDAASYLPLGDAAAFSRSPAAQAMIDALPKDRAELYKMQQDKTQAPINRHLAEYQLAFIESKEKGDVFKGLNASSYLTDLAERKIVLQAQWKESAVHFTSAIKDPNTNWAQLSKHSDIAPQAAIHLAAINSGYPAAFVEKMDATLAKNLATGTPVSSEMMAITKAVQVNATQPQADTQTAAHQQMEMTH